MIQFRFCRAPKLRAGFTLTETLIAVTILAVLATMLIPSANSGGTYLLQSATRILAADLRLARELAIQHDTEWTIRFDSANSQYELIHSGTGSIPLPNNPLAGLEDDPTTYVVSLNHRAATIDRSGAVRFDKIHLVSSNTDVTDITFGPLGGTGPSRGEDTVITLARGSSNALQTATITVSWVTGQVWVSR